MCFALSHGVSLCPSLFLGGLQSRETQGLVPVTVKQISEASQSGDEKSTFVINGVDVANVCSLVAFDVFLSTKDISLLYLPEKMYEVKKKRET